MQLVVWITQWVVGRWSGSGIPPLPDHRPILLGDSYHKLHYTVQSAWWWAKLLPETCQANEDGWVRQNTTVVGSYLLFRRWRHVSAVLGHVQVINKNIQPQPRNVCSTHGPKYPNLTKLKILHLKACSACPTTRS